MSEDLYYRLLHLGFSQADFELRDDGQGPYIAKWNSDSPQPDLNALEAVSKEQADAMQAKIVARQQAREAAIDKVIEEMAKFPSAAKEIKDYAESRKGR